jgi:cation diffusion facilitator family transporter
MIQGRQISDRAIQMRLFASIVSLLIGIIILAIKSYAYQITGSQTIYTDAMESIVNVVTAIMGLIVVYYGSKPADTDHPYGHGKVEYFSAAFEGGLITFAGILVIVEAVKSYKAPEVLRDLDFGLLLIFATGIMNLLLGVGLKYVGRKYASPSLIASGTHVMTDFFTSAAAIVGLLIVIWTQVKTLDIFIAAALGIHMIFAGGRLVRNSISGLMDAEDLELLRSLVPHLNNNAGRGIIQIHHARIIRAGWFHHIDAHVVVPEFWSIQVAHERLDEFEKKVINEYEFGGEANFHLDPCRRNYCAQCDLVNCEIRKEAFVQRNPVLIEELRSKAEPNWS